MQGHADVFCRFFTKCIKKAFKEHSIFPFDCALYLFMPIRIITMGVITAMGYIQIVYPQNAFVLGSGVIHPWILMSFAICQYLWLPFVMVVEKRISGRTIWGYITYIVYSFSWVPIAIVGFAKKNQHEWYHTQHTRNIKISDNDQ